MARAVAVLGGDAEPEQARALAGLSYAQARISRDELVAVSLLERGPHLSFVHPIVRNAIYEDIGPSERSWLHRRAAEVLTEQVASRERIAAHLVATEPRGEESVVASLCDAARHARDRGAPEAAVGYLRRALEEPPGPTSRVQVIKDLAIAELQVGAPGVLEHARLWLAEASRFEDRAAAAQLLATGLIVAGHDTEALDALARQRRELQREDPGLRHGLGRRSRPSAR
jgi:hypothetical protein